jgi:dTMP kinase
MGKIMIPGGFYLIVDGPDGGGKTTQGNLLADALGQDFDVLRVREPGGTAIGDEIRTVLLDRRHRGMSSLTELFLFSASRRETIEKIVAPALGDGKIVLSDRSYYSTEAYQGAAGNVDLESLNRVNAMATEGAAHNLAFIFDIDSAVGLARAGRVSGVADRIEEKTLAYHEKVREGYSRIAKRDSGVCVLIDASRDVNTIHDEVYRISKERIDMVLKDA